MKKSLLALAVLGAFAGVAQAQTNVTIYGVADIGLTRTKAGGQTRIGLDGGNQSGNRLGFKGSEDLGGGLKAEFQIENGFGLDDGTLGQGGRIFGRQAWLGLSGGFGSVKFGRQYTPMFLAIDSIDPFGTGIIGGASGWAGGERNSFHGLAGIRVDNAVDYSISFGAVSIQAQYAFGEVAGDNSANRQMGASISYANGPLTVVAAYQEAADANGKGYDFIDRSNPVVGPVPGTDGINDAFAEKSRTGIIGAAYDFGAAKVHAAYGAQGAKAPVAGLQSVKESIYAVGVTVPVSASGAVLAQYTRSDDRTRVDADTNYWGIGYTHGISKRTNLYTSYSRSKTDGVPANSWLNVGLRHKF